MILLPEYLEASADSKELNFDQKPKTKDQKPKLFAFCGIGNPSNFFRQLELDGLQIVEQRSFPDHNYYKQDDVLNLEKKARSVGAEALVTTAKDAVRLTELKFTLPCLVAEIDMFIDDHEAFKELICSL